IMLLFFFQAEDGIRDRNVTGVQTCALPILPLTSVTRNYIKELLCHVYQECLPGRRVRRPGRTQRRTERIPAGGGRGSRKPGAGRSEERRVGKEWRCRVSSSSEKKR